MKFIKLDSYLSAIRNSVDSKTFRNLFFEISDKKTDITKNGELSCAVFVSSILKMFDLIKKRHSTVSGTIKDLIDSGWKKIERPKRGSILVWEDKNTEEGVHKHVGFYVGQRQAISNRRSTRVPSIHHWTYGTKDKTPTRKVETIYWHQSLDRK